MIFKCGINGCNTRWIWMGFFYVRLNPLRTWACMHDKMFVGRRAWKATKLAKAIQAKKRATAQL